MDPLGKADVTSILADLATVGGAVRIALGSVTVNAVPVGRGAELFGGGMPPMVAGDEAVDIQAGALPGLASGSAVTVNGEARVVREVLPHDNGLMVRVSLRKP